jgi:fluoroquinolone transport system permease protein
MSTRTAQVVQLRRATVRSVRWPPALVAVLVVAALVTWRNGGLDAVGSALPIVRGVAVLLAVGAVFVLDDAAAVSVASVPAPLWWRRMLRYGVAAVFVLPAWVVVLVYAHSRQPDLPGLRLTLELAVLMTFGLAFAGAAARWFDATDPGMTAAIGVLGFTFIAANLPMRFALFASLGSRAWGPSTLRWAGMFLAVLAVLVASSRDPARARRRALRL